MSATDWGYLWEVRYGWGTLGEDRDGSGNPRRGPGCVAGPSEFRDGSRDPRRSETARWTLRKV